MMQTRSKPKGEYQNAGDLGNPNWLTTGEGYAQEMKAVGDRMSYEAKLKRHLFVSHYIKTLNKTASAEFAGFRSPACKGVKLLKEPYTQDLLHKMLHELDQDAIMTQNEILFQFKKEALNTEDGNQGARISALAHMAKIRGMMMDKQDPGHTIKGGVMLVPAMISPEDWEKTATAAQADLKETVRE